MKALTQEQCWTLASYLRTAAEQFREFSQQMTLPPANKGMAEQFEKQRVEANAFATLFENSNFAHLDVGEEEGN